MSKRRIAVEEKPPRPRTRAAKFQHERQYPPIQALTPRQKDYLKALATSDTVIVVGPAGTGKTYIAGTHAADLLRQGKIDRIILTRPNVSSGQKLGFDPGTQDEKMAPWMVPLVEAIKGRIGPGAFESAFNNGNIEFAPFEKMRGRTFDNAFIILDEAQNVTPHEMKMFLTRMGKNSQVVIDGDIEQDDLKVTSGLKTAIDLARKHLQDIPIIEFTVDDIVRSDRCGQWVRAFYLEKIQ